MRLYSRDLHDISGQFPEVVAGARGLPWDGDPRRRDPGLSRRRVMPFIALQARLGRKYPRPTIRAEVPVIYVAFDVLGARRSGGDAPWSRCSTAAAERRAPAGGARPAAGR